METSSRWHEVPHVLITKPCPLNLNLPGKCIMQANPMDSIGPSWYPRDSLGFRELHPCNPGVNVLPLACKPILLRSTGPARWYMHIMLVNLPKPKMYERHWILLKKNCQHKDDLRYRTFLNCFERTTHFGSFPSYMIFIHEVGQCVRLLLFRSNGRQGWWDQVPPLNHGSSRKMKTLRSFGRKLVEFLAKTTKKGYSDILIG